MSLPASRKDTVRSRLYNKGACEYAPSPAHASSVFTRQANLLQRLSHVTLAMFAFNRECGAQLVCVVLRVMFGRNAAFVAS
jgi:hypothetical protein